MSVPSLSLTRAPPQPPLQWPRRQQEEGLLECCPGSRGRSSSHTLRSLRRHTTGQRGKGAAKAQTQHDSQGLENDSLAAKPHLASLETNWQPEKGRRQLTKTPSSTRPIRRGGGALQPPAPLQQGRVRGWLGKARATSWRARSPRKSFHLQVGGRAGERGAGEATPGWQSTWQSGKRGR